MTRTARTLLLIAAVLLPFVYVEHQYHLSALKSLSSGPIVSVDWIDQKFPSSWCPWREQNTGCVKRT